MTVKQALWDSLVVRVTGDIAALGIVFAAFIKLLPPIAAGFSIIWIAMQMWSWLVNRKWRRR